MIHARDVEDAYNNKISDSIFKPYCFISIPDEPKGSGHEEPTLCFLFSRNIDRQNANFFVIYS